MEHHSGDFGVAVRDIRHYSQPESDALTLLWVLEGQLELHDGDLKQRLSPDELTIVNRHHRWSLHAPAANAVMLLTLSGGWLTRLDGDFFTVDYRVSAETRDADANLRRLMRQLLVVELVNHQARYRLEANRWLSEIALLLATRFSQPIASGPRRGADSWSRRITRVVARIDASYQRRLSLHEIAAAELVSEAWLSRLFRKEVGMSFMQYLTALRLNKAAGQLIATRKPVQQIALEHGFASTRIMSDLFKRLHGLTPRQFRQQHPQVVLEAARPRASQAEVWQPVAVERLYARLNEPESSGWDNPPPPLSPQQTRQIDLRQLPARAASLRHTRMVVTVRELDDLLREDVRHELERLHETLPVYAIDIHDPFLSSRLFATGWDDPQMAGYACWYNLQHIFSWLAKMGWGVILHTGITTRCDLLQRFLRLAADHFPAATLASWRFVWHWSPQASEEARQHAWRQQREVLRASLPQPQLGVWHRFPENAIDDDPLLQSPIPGEADFLACQADANELLDLAQLDSSKLAASENYPVHKLRQIHSALRQRQLTLPLWLLSWLWRRLRGEVLVNDKNLLLLRHNGHYQLLLRNTVVFNPWLSSEEAFIQRFSQPYSIQLSGLEAGRWRIKQHLFDRHHGALFPLFEAFRSHSGPDEEGYQWLMHKARPDLSVSEERPDTRWQIVDSLESNALALYEFTPLNG
ncbi:helix-turn-helix transcriptional regulator [Klebsiella sp. NPDC088457]